MNKFLNVLDSHKQKYQNSCTSSVREVILKLHQRVGDDWYDFQTKYKETNIGFDHLDDFDVHRIKAISYTKPIAEAYLDIEKEVREGRFPLVSLPFSCRASIIDFARGCGPYHIFIAGKSLISGLPFGYYSPNSSSFPGHTYLYDIGLVLTTLETIGPYQLNYATYVLV